MSTKINKKNRALLTTFTASLLSLNLFAAKPLSNFNDVQQSLLEGNQLNIVIELSSCSSYNNVFDKDKYTSFKPAKFKLTKDQNIKFSSVHYTQNNPKFTKQAVYEYTTYTVHANNDVTVKYQPILNNPANQSEYTNYINCKLAEGFKIFEN